MNNELSVEVNELKQLIENNPDLCLIDVREDYEWQEEHITHAIHIPKDEITDKIMAIVPDKNTPIYLHCKAGVRSLYAAQCLINLGYKNVYSVEGGIEAWKKHNYPISK